MNGKASGTLIEADITQIVNGTKHSRPASKLPTEVRVLCFMKCLLDLLYFQ